ncbi:hypothetical protein ONE63_003423 [Megalurothrips usitatus]|uniref:glutathione transferase n=1 Tax=Megalurothrips usitatus TaxID=439358 RepID=A0AAV7X786_9NEOP|nr:hypothetical protein ONE63_003423 [Megalurothrips usitatus]
MPDKYRLHYFDGTALGEPIRYLLAYGKCNWEDVRYKCKVDDGNMIKAPFGQLPILEINGKKFVQSTAISRYLGSLLGLSGADPLDNLAIDTAVDTFHDIRAQIASWYYDPNPESRAAKTKPLMTVQIPFYFKKLDELVQSNGGYVANGKLSWGDLYIAGPIKYLNFLVGFDLLQPYPHLHKLVKEVEAIPHIAEYIAGKPHDLW